MSEDQQNSNAGNVSPKPPAQCNSNSNRTTRESAADISRRYRLADLARARIFARRLYLNTLAKRASLTHYDLMADNEYVPEVDEIPLPSSSYLYDYIPDDEFVASRPNLYGPLPSRLMYNRRLAELEADRLEEAENAERLLTRYVTRSKAGKSSSSEKPDNETGEQKDEDGEDDRSLLREELDAGYVDVLNPLDLEYPDVLPRMRTYRRRVPYYRRRFRPLGVTTRLMERRLRN